MEPIRIEGHNIWSQSELRDIKHKGQSELRDITYGANKKKLKVKIRNLFQ